MWKKLKRRLLVFLAMAILLGLVFLALANSLQPGVKFSGSKPELQQEMAALQTTLKLRLAKAALAAIAQNSEQLTLAIGQDELDRILLALVMEANPPPNITFTGSKFTIAGNKGHWKVGMRLMDTLTVGLTATLAVAWEDNCLVLSLEQLKLGKLVLPEKIVSLLLAKLSPHHLRTPVNPGAIPQGETALVNPEKKEIHWPVDFQDDYLTLTAVYFSSAGGKGVLAMDFAIETKAIQDRLLAEIKQRGSHLSPWLWQN